MSDWISELKNNLAGEFGKRPVVATLATVVSTSSRLFLKAQGTAQAGSEGTPEGPDSRPVPSGPSGVPSDPAWGITPRADARSIVIRDLLDDGTLIITSDARSEKNAQLRSNPSATVVFWLPTLRWQCIVDAAVTILGGDSKETIRLDHWRKLSDSTRAMFAWPAPGESFDPAAGFKNELAADVNPPDSFEVLALNPIAVETLDVRAHPHRRVMWRRDDDAWTSRLVNP